ncbi:hypothetical protein ASF56_24740 [Methylobacterium sp. Leaf122]|nr:hypothetical protein [Methylobacterium sp. Leaf122]KQQ11531.1 hypothetical protein ASF56_24740 [Methylobacterium sp. Leaf122]
MTAASPQISVAVSPELLAALDRLAFENDESRAGTVRRILAEELRDLGRLPLKAPPTVQLGINNSLYRTEARS